MKSLFSTCLVIATLSSANPNAALADKLSDADLVALQVTMQSHIDSILVEGAMLNLDPATGSVISYYPTKAHPKIMTMGKNFIMCADFVDANGKTAMANFYVANDNGRYVVFNTTVGADPVLDKLMQDGKVAMAN